MVTCTPALKQVEQASVNGAAPPNTEDFNNKNKIKAAMSPAQEKETCMETQTQSKPDYEILSCRGSGRRVAGLCVQVGLKLPETGESHLK